MTNQFINDNKEITQQTGKTNLLKNSNGAETSINSDNNSGDMNILKDKNVFTPFINDYFSNVPEWKSTNLYYGDSIPEKELSKAMKTYNKFDIANEKILVHYNTIPMLASTGFVITESNLYWYLPKYPGGGAKKGKVPLENIKSLSLNDYNLPLLQDSNLWNKLRKTFGFTMSITCNGTKIGLISSQDKKELLILQFFLGTTLGRDGQLTEEEIELINSFNSLDPVDTTCWKPCPRCESTRVKESTADWYKFIAILIFAGIWIGIELSFWVYLLLGIILAFVWEIVVGTIWKCEDCGKKWSKLTKPSD